MVKMVNDFINGEWNNVEGCQELQGCGDQNLTVKPEHIRNDMRLNTFIFPFSLKTNNNSAGLKCPACCVVFHCKAPNQAL